MKPKHLNILCAVGLSFLLSFGGLGCMITALELSDRLLPVAAICLLAAVVTSLCFSLRWSRKLLPALWLCWMPVIFLPQSPFLDQGADLLRQLMSIYGPPYGISVPEFLLETSADSHLLPLLLVAQLISLGVCWTVQRQCSPILAYFSCVLPVAACMVLTDTVPAVALLLMWLTGLILLGISHKVRLRNRNQGDRLTLYCAIPVVLGLLLLTLLVPQKGYSPPVNLTFEQISDWFTDHFGKVVYVDPPEETKPINLSDRVDLRDADAQNNSKDVIMNVEAQFAGVVYLKGRDYDVYGGMEWISDLERRESAAFPGYNWLSHQGRLQVTTKQINQQQFVPYFTDTGYLSTGGSIENVDNSNIFTYSCYALRENWMQLWQSYYSETPPEINSRYLELPAETKQSARNILRQLAIPKDANLLDRVLCIGEFVKNSAVYNLTPERFPEGTEDLAIWFLEEAEEGYCVHFATSATVLLRAAGIPARYVEGYMVPVTAGRTAAVRGDMAHAWVEYYLSGVGWVVLDPTPSDDTQPPQPTDPTTDSTAEPPSQPTDSTTEPPEPSTEPNISTNPTIPTDSQPTVPVESNPGDTEPTELPTGGVFVPPEEQEASVPAWVVAVLIGLAAVMASGCIINLQWYLRRRHRLKRMHQGPSKQRTLAWYQECQRLCRYLDEPLPNLLQELTEKACFSPYELTRQELDQFSIFLRTGIKRLKKRNFFRRLVYRFIYAIY